jgi:hypothetical protein
MQKVGEPRLDDFSTKVLFADRRVITFGIGSVVLSLLCGLIFPSGPVWAFFLAAVAFVALLVADFNQLPIRVASHFGTDLVADGWTDRTSYLILIGVLGLCMSTPCAAMAFVDPTGKLNFVALACSCFGCYLLAFMYAIHRLVVRANRTDPARLATAPFWKVIATLPIAIAVLVVALVIPIL